MTDDPLAPLTQLPGVADGVTRAREAVDALLGNRVLRRRSGDVSAESVLRGAWAAAGLAGEDVPLAAVRSGAAADRPVVQGALRAYGALGQLADVWPRAPRQVLARLHALAAADLIGDGAGDGGGAVHGGGDELGRPRPGAAERLDVLAGVLGATSAPAVVVAGVVSAEVLSLDAFPPVSPVVALAAVRLVLVDRGLDPKSLVVVEAGHRELAEGYRDALASYLTGTPAGVATWLRHTADAVVAGAAESQAICEALRRG